MNARFRSDLEPENGSGSWNGAKPLSVCQSTISLQGCEGSAVAANPSSYTHLLNALLITIYVFNIHISKSILSLAAEAGDGVDG